MSGLILKDLLTLKKQAKLFAVLLIVYCAISCFTDMYMMSSVFVFVGGMLPITALAYDERAHWDRICPTLPVSRTQIVLSKYVLGLLLSAAGAVIYLLMLIIGERGFSAITENLVVAAGMFLAAMLMLSLSMPLLFWLGSEKFRLIFLLLFLLPVLLISTLGDTGLPALTPKQELWIAIGFTAGVLTLLVLSMALSAAIIRRKEY